MLTALAHNGPDGQGIWLEGPIVLGHSMLFTTPESLYETLPQRDNEERLAGNIFTLEPPIRLLVL